MHVKINRPVAVTENGKLRQFDPASNVQVSDETGQRLLRTLAATRVQAPLPEHRPKAKATRNRSKAKGKSEKTNTQDAQPAQDDAQPTVRGGFSEE